MSDNAKVWLVDNLITLTEAEWRAAANARLAELGLTYEQLKQQAEARHFGSTAGRKLWVLIGGTLDEGTAG